MLDFKCRLADDEAAVGGYDVKVPTAISTGRRSAEDAQNLWPTFRRLGMPLDDQIDIIDDFVLCWLLCSSTRIPSR